MTKRKRRSPLFIEETEPPISAHKRQSKLYADDDELIASRMKGGKSESELIRHYVHKGVKMEQLERASKDPYIRNLLKTFGDITSAKLSILENRLVVETHILRRFIAASIVLNHASLKFLQIYLATEPPPPASTVEERRKAFGETLFQTGVDEAEKKYIAKVLRERNQLLEMLSNTGRISDALDSALYPEEKPSSETENRPDKAATKSK